MRFLVHYGKTFTLLLLLFPLLGLSAYYLNVKYDNTKNSVLSIVKENILNEKSLLLENYAHFLIKQFGKDFISTLQNSETSINLAEQSLSLIKNSDVKYLYLLYIDKKDALRYLIDTTDNMLEKGELHQKFYPQSDIFQEAIKKQKIQITSQKEFDNLWITIVHPIVIDGETIAIVSADFSNQEHIKINNILFPLEDIFFYISILVVILFISTIVQLVIYYTSRKKSFIDPLTGMYNRQYLNEFLKQYPLTSFQMLILDLDHFKQVNDTYGHDAGDEVLRTVSKRITSVMRKKDVLIRYGGEEFLVLAFSNNTKSTINLAERIRKSIKSEPISLEETQLDVTVSIGLNPFVSHSSTFDHAVKVADEQLYNAKHKGRDRVEVYDLSMPQNTNEDKKLSDVKEALEDDRIYCVYQPIYTSKDNIICKYEMLVRMKDSEGKEILPFQFLPSIRRTQVYITLTQRVLSLAFATLHANDIEVSVNLDIQDLLDDDILKLFVEKFKNNTSLAKRLSVEILEHEEILEFTLIQERLETLKELGIQIAIDDFGSGFANYKYLLNLDINLLKIDGSLISGIHTNLNAYAVVNSINTLAHSLGIKTVAEHVENRGEYDALTSIGIDYLQGYYLAKPKKDILFQEV